MRPLRNAPAIALLALALGCARGEARPSPLDTKNELCRFCRMPVSDRHLAAQLAAPGEETKFYDDIGCLRDDLKRSGPPVKGSVAYVVDHRTAAWVRASVAVFSRCPALETPMGSHLVAHADAVSREADPASRGCGQISADEIFGSTLRSEGTSR
jgi:copper chaperone NosL